MDACSVAETLSWMSGTSDKCKTVNMLWDGLNIFIAGLHEMISMTTMISILNTITALYTKMQLEMSPQNGNFCSVCRKQQ